MSDRMHFNPVHCVFVALLAFQAGKGVTGDHAQGVSCDDSCTYANDGDCDDGGPGSEYTFCYTQVGESTDCTDCSRPRCDNSCSFAYDSSCDDGGPGAAFSTCASGTDCADCFVGTTAQPSPSPSPENTLPCGSIQIRGFTCSEGFFDITSQQYTPVGTTADGAPSVSYPTAMPHVSANL